MQANRDHHICIIPPPSPSPLPPFPATIIGIPELIEITVEEIRSVDAQENCQEFNVDAFSSDVSAASGNMLRMHVINSTGENVCTPSPCSPNPCQNGGACTEASDTGEGYTCSCTPGWEGTNCQTDVNECITGEQHLILLHNILCTRVCICTLYYVHALLYICICMYTVFILPECSCNT